MKKACILTEKIEKDFNDQLFVFTEINIKLTDWYIHHNEDFINYVLDSLQEWSNHKIDNWDINDDGGIYLKNTSKNTPDIQLAFYNKEKWASYKPKEEKIVLYLMDKDFEIDQRILKRKNIIKLAIIHELTHHYDNMFLKGKGINIGSEKTKTKFQNNIEKNAYTKQIIQQMEENIVDTIEEIVSTPNSNVETNFSTILHYSLGKVLQDNIELKEFMESLDEKTIKKVYKEIGEYFKNLIEKYYGVFNDFPRSIYDKINYNSPQKTNTKYSSNIKRSDTNV